MNEYHPVVEKILDILHSHSLWHETFEHEEVRTSEEAAKIRDGYTLHQGAKALIVKVTKRDKTKDFAMIVLPGDARFNSKIVKKYLDARDVVFATPDEVGQITGGILPGGVPPFGNIFRLPVYLDRTVLGNEKIVFNAGDRRFSIGMLASDFKDLVEPVLVDFVEES